VGLGGVVVGLLVVMLAVSLARRGRPRAVPVPEVTIAPPSTPAPGVEEPAVTPPEPEPDGTRAALLALERRGAFGFPQAQAEVICDQKDALRVSVWTNAEYLYVQAILWGDSEDVLDKIYDGREIGDRSHLRLDLDANVAATANVDRDYSLNPWPSYPGLHYDIVLGSSSSTALQSDSRGRGAIRHLDVGDGRRVRVDSFVIPLAELRKRPGETIRLVYVANSEHPRRSLNSAGYDSGDIEYLRKVPMRQYHELTLSSRGGAFDLTLVPDGKKEPQPSAAVARSGTKAGATTGGGRTAPWPPAVEALLSSLRNEGQVKLAEALTQEINKTCEEVESLRKRSPRSSDFVIVGRLVGEEWDDLSRVYSQFHNGGQVESAQMQIHGEGYFVRKVARSGRRYGFRRQGYLPLDLIATGEPGTVVYLGEFRLKPVSEATGAAVRGRVLLDGSAPAGAPAGVSLTIACPPMKGGGQYLSDDSSSAVVSRSGEFSASGLSPTDYSLRCSAPGYVTQGRSVVLRSGETLDVGTIALERAVPITVIYRWAVRPPFTRARTERQTVASGDVFRVNLQDARGDLFINQDEGEPRLRLNIRAAIADLGPGRIDDFLEIDPASAKLTSESSVVVPQSGHVYLMDQQWLDHWVLFELQFDAKKKPR
jgi:hypothetical protein